MPSTIIDTKRDGGLEGLARRIGEGLTVMVGIQGSEASAASGKRGTTLADLCAIHEYGLGGLPQRSWLRGWFDERQEAIQRMIRTGYQQVIAGTITAQQLAEALGVQMVQEIQTRWTRPGVFAPNAPSTVAAKGMGGSSVTGWGRRAAAPAGSVLRAGGGARR